MTSIGDHSPDGPDHFDANGLIKPACFLLGVTKMDRLPREILLLLVENIAPSTTNYDNWADVAALRRTSKAMAAVATPAVFRTVSLWMSLKSLRSLNAIAENPQL